MPPKHLATIRVYYQAGPGIRIIEIGTENDGWTGDFLQPNQDHVIDGDGGINIEYPQAEPKILDLGCYEPMPLDGRTVTIAVRQRLGVMTSVPIGSHNPFLLQLDDVSTAYGHCNIPGLNGLTPLLMGSHQSFLLRFGGGIIVVQAIKNATPRIIQIVENEIRKFCSPDENFDEGNFDEGYKESLGKATSALKDLQV
ncbi:hypothetical protein CC78DRAFT_547210 [Lojkania enalia]|uniref:Uncharacterized protein n=1 Tax=Lojkania enalia TaxID=147567 RepID=A0A9P4K794_9PLEO|nr:hypothetical protein CC78DRAFT_547210 [Didymosphaeria enalia]